MKARQIQPLTPLVSISGSSKNFEATCSDAVSRRRATRRILRAHPGLGPASSIFSGRDAFYRHVIGGDSSKALFGPSKQSVKEAAKLQPVSSDLLAIGSVRLPDKSKKNTSNDRRYRGVIAFPSGSSGEVLTLKLLNKEHLRWQGDPETTLYAETASDGEVGFGVGTGAPIRQIVFGQGSKRATNWLAVRQDTRVSIFRPRVRAAIVAPTLGNNATLRLPPSRIDANLVCTFDCHDFDNVPFSDVAFELSTVERLAVITRTGSWSVWSLQLQLTTDKQRKACLVASGGSLQDDGFSSRLDSHVNVAAKLEKSQDGWWKTVWLHDSTTLAIANRNTVKLLHISDGNATRELRAPGFSRLETGPSKDSILDLRLDVTSSDRLLVLTTCRLFWLRLDGSVKKSKGKVIGSQDSAEIDVAVLLSWVHFFNPNDTSLTISQFQDLSDKNPASDEGKYNCLRLIRADISSHPNHCTLAIEQNGLGLHIPLSRRNSSRRFRL